MPSGPQPWPLESVLTSQLVVEPVVDTPTVLPLRSLTPLTEPSLRATSTKRSGGPASAATALAGEPLTRNARSGPPPSAMSMAPEARPSCSFELPAKPIDSISRPCFLKMPVCMPTSSGTKENAAGSALPTRSVSAAALLVTRLSTAAARIATMNACRIKLRMARFALDGCRFPRRKGSRGKHLYRDVPRAARARRPAALPPGRRSALRAPRPAPRRPHRPARRLRHFGAPLCPARRRLDHVYRRAGSDPKHVRCDAGISDHCRRRYRLRQRDERAAHRHRVRQSRRGLAAHRGSALAEEMRSLRRGARGG